MFKVSRYQVFNTEKMRIGSDISISMSERLWYVIMYLLDLETYT
jgi:hypothetical protein